MEGRGGRGRKRYYAWAAPDKDTEIPYTTRRRLDRLDEQPQEDEPHNEGDINDGRVHEVQEEEDQLTAEAEDEPHNEGDINDGRVYEVVPEEEDQVAAEADPDYLPPDGNDRGFVPIHDNEEVNISLLSHSTSNDSDDGSDYAPEDGDDSHVSSNSSDGQGSSSDQGSPVSNNKNINIDNALADDNCAYSNPSDEHASSCGMHSPSVLSDGNNIDSDNAPADDDCDYSNPSNDEDNNSENLDSSDGHTNSSDRGSDMGSFSALNDENDIHIEEENDRINPADEQEGYEDNEAPSDEPLKPQEVLKRLLEGVSGGLLAIPLQQSVCVSKAQIMLNFLEVANLHKTSHALHVHMLQAFNAAFSSRLVPDTRYLLDQFYSGSAGIKYHFYCCFCYECFSDVMKTETGLEKICRNCKTKNNLSNMNVAKYFCTLDLSYQLEILFDDPDLAASLRDISVNSNNDFISDLYDGSVHKIFCQSLDLSDKSVKHLSFTMSVDGSPLYKSSNCEIWPIFLMVNELPPYPRMKNLLLGGLWFGDKKPHYDVFLEPFVAHLNVLSRNGCLLKISNELVKFKCHLIGCSIDSGARGAVQGIHAHNGESSCSWCLQRGTVEGGGSSARKFLYEQPQPLKRSHSGFLVDTRAVLNLKKQAKTLSALQKIHVNGVVNASPLLCLPKLDIVSGMVVDYLHNVCLGVTRQFFRLMLGLDGIDQNPITKKNPPYYIGSPENLDKLNAKIALIQPPIEVRNMIRCLDDIANFKGKEYENLVLYYSIPILTNVLPDNYLRHWSWLVHALHLLLSEKITEQELETADELLHRFVKQVQILYKNQSNDLPCKQMTFNVHLLLHLVDHVRRWGPLMRVSAFAFESGNGDMKRKIKANKGIPKQILRSYGQNCALHLLRNHVSSLQTERFRQKICPDDPGRTEYVDGETKLCGASLKFNPTNHEKWLLEQAGRNDLKKYKEFVKLIFKHCCYTVNSRGRQRNNDYAHSSSGLVKIRRIIADPLEDDVLLFVSIVHVKQVLQLPTHVCCQVDIVEEDLKLLTRFDLNTICVSMDLESDGHFISVMPNISNVF